MTLADLSKWSLEELLGLAKLYVEQAIEPDGLPCDSLAYTMQMSAITEAMQMAYPSSDWTERDAYHALQVMRKAEMLPRLFRKRTPVKG